MELELQVVSGNDAGKSFTVRPDRPTVIGRSSSCDLCLTDPSVSRRHCRIERASDAWTVTDLDSHCGTACDGVEVMASRLKDGVRLSLGETTLIVKIRGEENQNEAASSSQNDHSLALLRRFRAGDEQAAVEIFDRYTLRLMAIARQRISAQLARRIDPEDVVQSVYRSFFRQARSSTVEPEVGRLWNLLAGITVKKVLGQVEFHTAGKRTMRAEQPMPAGSAVFAMSEEFIDREPSPAEAAALNDEVERLLSSCDAEERQIWELRLQGEDLEAIAVRVKKSTRTVRRVLTRIGQQLEQRLQQELVKSPNPQQEGHHPPQPHSDLAEE
jgi:RNA polymerase sigma-70 factor (ECF subfamily)